jgi:hypothetical protein
MKKPTEPKANWQSVFGKDAGEFFQVWHVARFIGEVAAAGQPWHYLAVEKGQYGNGQFVPRRILNGDQTVWRLIFAEHPTVLRVLLYTR